MIQPDVIFETSWEVCNRIGGIYTVLSTKAASMQAEHPDRVFFFGPDLGDLSDCFFCENRRLLKGWHFPNVRIGRWNIPGMPIAILVRYDSLWDSKNDIYAWAWQRFGVQSHAAISDYDDSSLFGYAVGKAIESLSAYIRMHDGSSRFVAHINEWQTAFALFYLRESCPDIATIFTTHATGIGRSIAGNGKPLYDCFRGFNGDQMAGELGMVSKHSAEKQAAYWSHCFTTVSDITARECEQLLDCKPDIVTPNGFASGFAPCGKHFALSRQRARQALKALSCTESMSSPIFVCIAGRQEWKNKGIDVFLDAMERLSREYEGRTIVAFVMIPYLSRSEWNAGNVKVVFVPYYLPSEEAPESIRGYSYYDLLIGMNLTIFPSYYEPWGYTPLESVVFHVPTITTNLSGFGIWAAQEGVSHLSQGVCVIPRSDSNYDEVVGRVVREVREFAAWDLQSESDARKAAAAIASKAQWKHFFGFYRKAYSIALANCISSNKG